MKLRLCSLLLLMILPIMGVSQELNSTKPHIDRYSVRLDGGIGAGSPNCIVGEMTISANVTLCKHHVLGLGWGYGGGTFQFEDYGNDYSLSRDYMPIFATYRYLLRPDRIFTPQFAASLGGLINSTSQYYNYREYNFGIYSNISAGFRVGVFSVMGGLTFMPMCVDIRIRLSYEDYYNRQWIFPCGVSIKLGLEF